MRLAMLGHPCIGPSGFMSSRPRRPRRQPGQATVQQQGQTSTPAAGLMDPFPSSFHPLLVCPRNDKRITVIHPSIHRSEEHVPSLPPSLESHATWRKWVNHVLRHILPSSTGLGECFLARLRVYWWEHEMLLNMMEAFFQHKPVVLLLQCTMW